MLVKTPAIAAAGTSPSRRAARRLAPALVAAALLLPAAGARAQGPPPRIAVVDLDLVALQSPAGVALQKKLQDFEKQIQAEIETRTQKARQIRQRATDGELALSDEQLAELQKEYEDAMIAIRRFRDDKQREGEKVRTEGLRQVEEQLRPVLVKVREEGGYDLILNNVPGVVVMASERVDITDQVTALLQVEIEN